MRIGTTLRLAIAPTIPHMCSTLFLFFRPRPPGNGRLLYPRERELSGRGILGERGSGAERCALAHPHRGDKLGVRADGDVVLDDRAVLVRPVVVAGDRAGADVDVFSDLAVADIGKVIGFGALTDAARLDFDEVAEVHVGGEARARPDAGVGTDAAVRADVGLLDVAEWLDRRAGRDFHALQNAVGPDGDAVTQPHLAFEHAIDIDGHIAAAGKHAANVAARRVGERHPLLHERVHKVALVDALQFRELAAAVHTERLPRGVCPRRHHRHALPRCEHDDIGEVIFLLGIVVFQFREPGFELPCRRDNDTGVYLAERALPRRGVLFLDNAHNPFAVSYDAPIPCGVVRCRGEQAQTFPRGFDQALERPGPNQRDVAVQHEGRPALVEMRHGLHHRVARAELRVLPDPDRSVFSHGLAHGLAAVAVDDADDLRRQALRRVDDMRDERPAGETMQHLGRIRLHALAETGGEDDDIHTERIQPDARLPR